MRDRDNSWRQERLDGAAVGDEKVSGDLGEELEDIPEPAVSWRGNSHQMFDKKKEDTKLFHYS